MKIKYIDGPLIKKMILFGAQNLENNKHIVNDLNVFPVPDGDTGTNMALTIQFAAKEVSQVKSDNLSKIMDAAANGSLMGARGNSGVILSQLFRGFAKGCKDKKMLGLKDLSEALQSGTDMAYKAVMKPTEGTILTVAKETSKFAIQNAENFDSLEKFIENIIEQGNHTLSKTPDMLPVLQEAGVVDAGGKGLMCILEGVYRALFEEDIEIEQNISSIQSQNTNKENISTSDIKYAYCTEFMVLTKKMEIDNIKSHLSKMGDSLLVVGDDHRIKVHVHTNHPGKVLEYALQTGEITNIKIDNMKEQHRSQFDFDRQEDISVEEKEYAFVSVATGAGITEILQDLGVDSVIQGGQTMNPSTEDFLKEIDKLQAKYIYILPNNSNILMAANQAKEISDKNIEVVPSKTIPQGISALLAFNIEKNAIDNYKGMKEAIEEVKTAQITFAVRDTQVNGLSIKKDNIIGLYEGEIISVGQDISEVTLHLLEKVIETEDELITIFAGQGVSEEQKEVIQDKVENTFPNIDVEVHNGGQPLYYYIISVE